MILAWLQCNGGQKWGFAIELALRFTTEREPVGGMQDAVENRVSESGIIEKGMPMQGCQLAAHHGRTGAHPIIKDFQQIIALGLGQRGHGPIVEDQQIDLRQSRETFAKAAVATGDTQFLQKAGQTPVENGQ